MTRRVLGVDACKGGWIGIALDAGGQVGAYFARQIGTLVADADVACEIAVVGIDIPIGVPTTGHRLADEQARAAVGTRRSAVFMTPVRAVLEAKSYAAALEVCAAAGLPGVSRQAYGLGMRIEQVERWLEGVDRRVIEVHPEVSFAELAGEPLEHSKHTWAGIQERRRLLVDAGIELPSDLGSAGARAGVDDVLDAAAAAWTARRFAEERARRLPLEPQYAEHSLRYTIWV